MTPKTKRRPRRSSRVVRALNVELHVPLDVVVAKAGQPVPDEPATIKRLAADGVVAGARRIGAQRLTVTVERVAGDQLVAIVRFEDAEEEWRTR